MKKTLKHCDQRQAVPEAGIQAYIFGYGSLMHDWLTKEYLIANIKGYRRDWEATMDNTHDIAGYKYYVDNAGSREGIGYVSFLNVSRRSGKQERATGLLKPVCPLEMQALDARERNYWRIDVTRSIEVIDERASLLEPYQIWTYTASAAARLRTRAMRQARFPQTVPASYYRAYQLAVKAIMSDQSAGNPLRFEVDEPDYIAAIQSVAIAK